MAKINPNDVLQQIAEAEDYGDDDAASVLADQLQAWLDDGGAQPEWARHLAVASKWFGIRASEEFISAYLDAALEYQGSEGTVEDLRQEAVVEAVADCGLFSEQNRDALKTIGNDTWAGNDFYFFRNGFRNSESPMLSRNVKSPAARRAVKQLKKSADAFGGAQLAWGRDGQLHWVYT